MLTTTIALRNAPAQHSPAPRRGTLKEVLGTLATAVLILSLSGCASWDGLSYRQKSAAVGAGIGGVAGAAISGGSVLGTAGGAAIGGVIGDQLGRGYGDRGPRR